MKPLKGSDGRTLLVCAAVLEVVVVGAMIWLRPATVLALFSTGIDHGTFVWMVCLCFWLFYCFVGCALAVALMDWGRAWLRGALSSLRLFS